MCQSLQMILEHTEVWVLIRVCSTKRMIFFSFDTNTPIPMVQYCDSHTWGKYCQHFMELDFYGKGQVNNNLHGSFCSSMINFLETDIAGNATYSMNPNILSQLQQFLMAYSTSGLDKKQNLPCGSKKKKLLFRTNYQQLRLQPLVFHFQFIQR